MAERRRTSGSTTRVLDVFAKRYHVSLKQLEDRLDVVMEPRPRAQLHGVLWRRAAAQTSDVSEFFDFMHPYRMLPRRTLDDNQEMTSETYVREQARCQAWSSEMPNVQDPRRVMGTHQQDIATPEEAQRAAVPLPVDPDERPVSLSSVEAAAMHSVNLIKNSKNVADPFQTPPNVKLYNRVTGFFYTSARRSCDNENGCYAADLNKQHMETMEKHPECFQPLSPEDMKRIGRTPPRTQMFGVDLAEFDNQIPEPPYGDQTCMKRRAVDLRNDEPPDLDDMNLEQVKDEPTCTLSPNTATDERCSGDEAEPAAMPAETEEKMLTPSDFLGMPSEGVIDRFANDQRIGLIDTDIESTIDGAVRGFDRPVIADESEEQSSAVLDTGMVIQPYDDGRSGSGGGGGAIQAKGVGRMPFSYRKNFDSHNSALAGILQHIDSRSQEECGKAFFAVCMSAFSTARQSSYVPQSVNTTLRRVELPAVPRAVEEACMRQRLKHESECINGNLCQGKKISQRFGEGFVMVSLESALQTIGPTLPESVYNAMKSDICILCRRYLVSLGVTAAKTSAIKNAPPNYSVSTWVNIIDCPHEYLKEDCDFPISNGCDGIYGPLVRHNIHAYELGVMHIAGHPPLMKLIQRYRMPTLDTVVNFQEGSRGYSLCQ